MPDQPKISVVIASINRPTVLEETLESLKRQTHAAHEIIISLVSPEDCTESAKSDADIKVVYGPAGSTFQRNTGMRAMDPAAKYILFLDDDMALSRSYLENCAKVMEEDEGIVLVAGDVLALDTDRESAEQIIRSYDAAPPAQRLSALSHANGCNMFARAAIGRTILFDENLPLYALNEDYDWTRQLAAKGRIVHASACGVVHLRTLSGRVSDKRFGYAQIANPYYLWRKGSIKSVSRLLKRHWGHSLPMNIVFSIVSNKNGPDRKQRRERLFGNLTAFLDLVRGRCMPRRILEL